MKMWRYYLLGRKFKLRIDNSSLRWIKTLDPPKGIILRWLETLANYDFDVEHRPGKKHANADILSRIDHAKEPTQKEIRASEEELVCDISMPTAHTPPQNWHRGQWHPP